jgi:hypothetical protein
MLTVVKPAKPTPTRRTPATAATDLMCLGEILQALGAVDDLSPSLIGWLGDQLACAGRQRSAAPGRAHKRKTPPRMVAGRRVSLGFDPDRLSGRQRPAVASESTYAALSDPQPSAAPSNCLASFAAHGSEPPRAGAEAVLHARGPGKGPSIAILRQAR